MTINKFLSHIHANNLFICNRISLHEHQHEKNMIVFNKLRHPYLVYIDFEYDFGYCFLI